MEIYDYEESLMAKTAWYYYSENMTQQNISEVLGISRMRVIKLLEKAKQSGIIQFRIRSNIDKRMQLEQNLIEKFNLENNCQVSEKEFFRIVKAGFAAKRKKISKSLSANLAISKEKSAEILEACEISPDLRAQDLKINDWLKISKLFFNR